MRYKIAIISGLLILSLTIAGITYRSFSQTGLLMSVYGWIRDVNTGEIVSGVTINLFKITSEGRWKYISSGTSDRNGFYKIKHLEAGKYRFFIELPRIGMVFIGGHEDSIEPNDIPIEDKSGEDYYALEIIEGRNTNLNIFLGEGLVDIKRPGIRGWWEN